ncbi:hypothetical protein G7007_09325 [Pseudomonas entomophila]|uniref:hypothetical protein n=1 Tax=Pseudomonas entomophila TaxID=312306 RepID=UPI0015E2BF24|nr:hypothetical protein [Pseudomonas entomophila]MBA1193060.1 hypothetical protein [Pseudomonas entomophila]
MSTTISQEPNLKIKVKSKFNYGGRNTEIDIRDSELILVKKATTEREFCLPFGLYEISAFLGDGKRAAKVIEILPNYVAEVTFEPEFDPQPSAPGDDQEFRSVSRLEQSDSQNIKVIDTGSDFSIYPTDKYWIIQHKASMHHVSVLTCVQDDNRIQVSLPISEGHVYSVTCHVGRSSSPSYSPIAVNISQSRSIAFGLESMLKSGQITKAATVASNALETLIDTFIDPTGALLAALILYKTGKINSWEQNLLKRLEQSHSWLPDCKVILALHFAANDKSADALQLACEASKDRILLTETFSLLLDLLRYWPDATANKERNDALSRMAQIAPLVKWDSMYLTTITKRI